MAADLVTLFLMLYRSKAIKNNVDEGLVYIVFSVILCFGAKFVTDWTFSALITLSGSVQCLGFCLLRLQIRKQRGAMGISSRALQLFVIMYICRLFSTIQYNGYLPVDRSGDWFYQAVDCVSLVVVVSILAAVHGIHEKSYEKQNDSCQIYWFIVVCAVLAYFVHPHLNNRKLPDMAWTCALYLESIAMVPQLFLLTKKGGEVENLSSHYIACVFFSRLLMLSFWLNSYVELKPKGADFNVPGYGVIGAQLLQVVIFGDFMYLYIQSVRTRGKLVLPTTIVL